MNMQGFLFIKLNFYQKNAFKKRNSDGLHKGNLKDCLNQIHVQKGRITMMKMRWKKWLAGAMGLLLLAVLVPPGAATQPEQVHAQELTGIFSQTQPEAPVGRNMFWMQTSPWTPTPCARG